jgi:hypothetical protein
MTTETVKVGNTTYVITDPENKKVKKLYSFDNLEELITMDQTFQDSFMNTLHGYLREKDEVTTTRRKDKVGDWIMCRGYKIQVDDELGFTISDMQNYARVCEEFDNPCPTPREVWDFINSSTHRKKSKEVFVKVTPKVVVEKEEKHYTEKAEDELVSSEYELLRADLLNELEGLSVPKMVEMVYKYIPNRKFNHRVNKLCNAYLAKEMRGLKFRNELTELINTHKFEEVKKVAKKFVGLGWYNINTLEVVKDSISFVTKTEGRFHFSKSEFLARYLLHLEPKIMPQMWRFINGFLTREQFLEAPLLTGDTEAKYIDFDISCLRKPNEELDAICNKILKIWEEPNPLGICYKNDLTTELKVGDYVEVQWKDFHTSYEGKVIGFNGGIRIRYEDGEVMPLYKWQEVEVLSKRPE